MHRPQRSDSRAGRLMIYAAWLLLLGLLTLFFARLLERQENPNPSPEARSAGGAIEVALRRNRGGHYVATASINGQPVRVLLDTGATDVSIPQGVADRLGLAYGPAMGARTAAGYITVYGTRLDRVELGGIVRRGVRASINPADGSEVVLLGMSFMRDLEIIQRGSTLTLRDVSGRP